METTELSQSVPNLIYLIIVIFTKKQEKKECRFILMILYQPNLKNIKHLSDHLFVFYNYN